MKMQEWKRVRYLFDHDPQQDSAGHRMATAGC